MTAINNPTPISDRATLDEYQTAAVLTAIYPGHGTPIGLAYVGLKLNGEAGEAAEHIGKAMRDDHFLELEYLTAERKSAIIKELGDVLWYVAAAARELGVSLDFVAQQNIEKLRSRAARNQLQGSGDER